MNIIFLDIDGVMNNGLWCKRSDKHHGLEFDPMCVRNLKEILETTDSKLVISSTWRIGETVESINDKVLKHYGLDSYVVGLTPLFWGTIRGIEIQHFLVHTKHQVEKFIIIDDDKDMGDLIHRLVRTSPRRGLDDNKKEEAIRLMKGA